MSVGLIYDERYLQHDTGPAHPERSDRLRAIHTKLSGNGLMDELAVLEPQPAAVDRITAVHGPKYVERVRETCASGLGIMDCPDTPVCGTSYEIALLSAGGALGAVDAVMAGDVAGAMSLGRPPGHHAEKIQAMGFCLFNNVAIAAEHLVGQHGLERVAIIDYDVHHGNGTQHAFEERGDVFFASTHEHPKFQFPGTGFEHETGRGDGAGKTLNVPLLPGTGEAEVKAAFDDRVLPALEAFDPQFVLVSAGFDADARDPLGHLRWGSDTFAWLTEKLVGVAKTHAQGRTVCVLEGGYHLEALSEGVAAVLGVMRDTL